MSRYTGPSCKKCRKLDCKLFLKGTKCYTNCVIDKLAAVTKRGGKVRRAKVSEYGVRLQEKQKARLQSGMSEIPFRNLFDAAAKAEGKKKWLKVLASEAFSDLLAQEAMAEAENSKTEA